MDVREKMVELIEYARYCGSNTSEEIADNLIANGVTVQTNADRIRAMSDEELAKQFSHTSICEQKYPKCMIDGEECAECLLEWLKQPAK